jgi:small subunit ribosomal protein S6
MFLISQAVAVDLQGAVDHIREILSRAGATIFAMKKWDERRFAYEIKKQKRGVYLLVYFSAPAASLAQIERSCNLSEKLLRTLVTRCDHLTPEEMRLADAQKELEVEARLRAQRAAEGVTEPEPPRPEPREVEEADIDAADINV